MIRRDLALVFTVVVLVATLPSGGVSNAQSLPPEL